MARDLMRYDRLVDAALRGVMAKALARAAEHGLPGDHHFYISFRTDHPGAEVSPALRARFPEEMTIVLQHQFWDLEVDDDRFAVTLAFGGVRQRLVVPFEAVTAFADPSVKFAVPFQAAAAAGITATAETSPAAETPPADETPPAADVVTLDAFRPKK